MDPLLEKHLISTKNASEISGYTSDYLSRLARAGKIRGEQVGRTWVVDKHSLNSFIEDQGKKKEDFARELSRTRADEYRAKSAGAPAAPRYAPRIASPFVKAVSPSLAHTSSHLALRTPVSLLRHSSLAAFIAVISVAAGAYAAEGKAFDAFAASAARTAMSAADGFHTILGDSAARIHANVERAALALDSAPAASLATVAVTPVELPTEIRINGIPNDRARAAATGAAPLAQAPRVPYSVGAAALALGASVRDALSHTPHALLAADLAFARATVGASDAIVASYADGVRAYAAAAPEIAPRAIAAAYAIGNATGNVAASLPHTGAAAYRAGALAFVNTADTVAHAVVTNEIAFGSALTRGSNRTAETALAPLSAAGRVAYAVPASLIGNAISTESGPHAAVALANDGSTTVSVEANVASPANVGEAARAYVARGFDAFFARAREALAFVFAPAKPFAFAPPAPSTVSAYPPAPAAPSQVFIGTTTEVAVTRNIHNTYGGTQTIIQGVSQAYVDSSVAAARDLFLENLDSAVSHFHHSSGGSGSNSGGSGSVTSVDASGGTTGLAFAGGPITDSGTLTLSGTLAVANGGTGITATPNYGDVLLGNSSGGYDLVSTSTLGIAAGGNPSWGSIIGTLSNQTDLQNALDAKFATTAFGSSFYTFFHATTTDALAEGTANLYYTPNRVAGVIAGTTTDALAEGTINKYFTNARADARFITDLSATTSVASITSLPNLSLPLTQTSGTLAITRGGTGTSTAPGANKLLFSDASGNWEYVSTSTLGFGSGSGSVSSVDASGGTTGLAFTGGPITGSGTLTLGGTLGVASGGTGLGSAPTYGQVLVGNASGGYTLTSTSSLGIASAVWGNITGTLSNQTDLQNALDAKFATTAFGSNFYTFFHATTTDALTQGSINKYYSTNLFAADLAGTTTSALAEGSNLYFTNARADARAVSVLSATTSVASITTLPNLSLPYAQLTGTLGVANGGTGSTTLTGILGGNGTGAVKTIVVGSGLAFDGTTISSTAGGGSVTSVDASGGTTGLSFSGGPITGSGVLTLGGVLGTANGGTGASSFGAPFYTFFHATTTDALTQGSINKYYSTNLFAADLAGTTTSALAEGSNLYFTNARADARAVSVLSATTSVASITTLPNLSLPYAQLTGTPSTENPLTFTYPLTRTSNTISLAFGTTTSNTWAGTQTFTNASSTAFSSVYASSTNAFFGNLLVGNLSGLLKATAGVVSTATAGTDYFLPSAFGSSFYTFFHATTTDALAEGTTNLYYTPARDTANFISNLAATTSVASITTLPNLSLPTSQLSGFLAIANGGTGTTTGGVTNGVEYYNGSTLTNSSGFVFNGTNVGIGTSSPSSLLVVAAAPSTPATLQVDSGGTGAGTVLSLTKLGTEYGRLTSAASANGVTLVSTRSNGNVTLAPGNASSITLVAFSSANSISGGAVGIATSSAASRLVVGGNASIGADYAIAAPTNGLLVEGNVGIGTTTPTTALGVQGDALFSGNLSLANITATGTAKIGTLTGILKATSGVVSTAIAGTDYLTPGTLGASFYTFFHATTTDALAQGTNNLYWTNTRFDNRLSATTSVAGITTLPNLSLPTSQLSGAVTQVNGGTGFATYTPGDILYADNSGMLAKLPVGSTGQVLKVQAGLPSWGVDSTVGGGGSDGIFATSTGRIYPLDTASAVLIGTNSTSTNNSIFEVNGQQYISSKLGIATTSPVAALSVGGNAYFTGGLGVGVSNTGAGTLQTSGNATIGGTFTVSGTGTSTFAGPLSLPNLALTNNFGLLKASTGGYVTNAVAGTDYLTSGTLGASFYTFFHATTTDALTEGTTNFYFTNTRADARFVTDLAATTSVASITTLPNLALPTSQLSGFLSIAHGGTGTSTAPSYGQFLVGDAAGNYEFTSTSTLGLPTFGGLSATYPVLYNGAGNFSLAFGTTTSNTWAGTQTFTNPIAVGSGTGTSTVNGNVSLTGNIVPSISNTYSLGSTLFPFKDVFVGPGSLYVNGQEVIHTNVGDDVIVSADPGENLQVKTSSGGALQLNPGTTGNVQLMGPLSVTAGKNITTTDSSALPIPSGVAAGNITVSGNAVTATNLNGGISLTPTGTGGVYVTSGNFGVATTSPTNPLEVNGSSYLGGTLKVTGATTLATSLTGILKATAGVVSTATAGTDYLAPSAFGAFFYTFFHATTTDALTEGTTNLYYTANRVAGVIAGTTTDALAQGSVNKYFSNALADARFITDLAATTSVASITTLPNLSLPVGQLTGTLGVANGGTGSTTLTGLLKGNGTGGIQTAIPGTDYLTSTTGVTSVTNSDGTLTVSPTTGAVTASLNLAHANTFTALQQFNGNASTTQVSVTGKAYFGGTSTTTISSTGAITLGDNLIGNNKTITGISGLTLNSGSTIAAPAGILALSTGGSVTGNSSNITFTGGNNDINLSGTAGANTIELLGSGGSNGLTIGGSGGNNFISLIGNNSSITVQGTGSLITTPALTVGTLNGPLQANNGVVSATSSIGVLYGGTGTTTFGANGVAYYDGTNSRLTNSSNFIVSGANVGIGSSTPGLPLSVGGNGYVSGQLSVGSNIVTTGNVTTGTLALTSGPLSSLYGGTNTAVASYAINTLIYGNGSGFNQLAAANNKVLTSSGTGAPTWSTSLGIANGGTGATSLPANSILYTNSAGTLVVGTATSSLGILTTNVAEGTNQYFTNARAIAATLTGYTSGAGTISASDSILSAIQKLNGNIGALVTGVSSVQNVDGSLTILPTSGNVIATLNTGHANTFTALQQFNGNASSTQFTSTGNTYLATAGGSVGIGSTTPNFKLSVEGTSSLGNQAIAGFFTGTTTATSTLAGPLSTANLAITGIASGNLLKTGAGGYVVPAVAGTDYLTTSSAVSSIKQSFGSAQTGAITLATSSQATNGQTVGLNITNSGSTFTFAPAISGTLAVGGGGTGVTSFGGTNTLLYTTAANTLSSITTATNGVLITSGTGVPSISSSLPTAVQNTISALNIANFNTAAATWIATIDTDSLAEGPTNKYFHNALADARFITDLAATTSVASITTLPNLSLPVGQLTGTLGVANGGTGSTTLTGLLKGNGTGGIQTAIPGTDYLTSSTGVTSVTNVDASLTVSPTTGAVIASLNLAHANTFTALQQFNGNASSTQFTSTGNTYLATAGGSVGIGTTSPAQAFSVQGNAYINGDITNVANIVATGTLKLGNNTGIFFRNGGLTNNRLAFNWDTLNNVNVGDINNSQNSSLNLFAGNNGAINFVNNTATTSVITSSGLFGIGTTSPTQRLSVQGNELLSGDLSLANLTATGTANVGNLINNGLTANTLIYANGSKQETSVTTGTAGNVLALLNGIPTWTATTTAGTGLTYSAGAFNVNTTQNISTLSNLATAGFVKTSATGVLSVDTNTYLTSSTGVTSVSNVDGSLTVSPTTGAVIASLNLAHANTFTALQQFNANASTTQFTSTGSTYLATAGGNVGIGTTSPWALLSVAGTGPYFAVSNSSGSLPRFTIDSTGNTLVGSATAYPTDTITGQFQVIGTGSNTAMSQERFSNTSGGAPRFFLAKSRGATVGDFTAVQTDDILGTIQWSGADGSTFGTTTAQIDARASQNFTTTSSGSYLTFRTSAGSGSLTEQVRLTALGNLIIGSSATQNGSADLTSGRLIVTATTTDASADTIVAESLRAGIVSGNQIGNIAFRSNDSNLTAPGVDVAQISALASGTHTAASLATDLAFYTTTSLGTATDTERMRITSEGLVGVGTSTPAAQLDVQGISGGMAFRATSQTGASLFEIESNGNIGISSTTAGSLLSIGTTNGINFSTATSTFSSTGGINLAAGCYAINGTCMSLANIGGTLAVAQGGTGSTTLTGILKGSGTGSVQTAIPGTDYLTPSTGVTSVTNSDSTLTISPATGAVVASLNLAHANTWTALQTFSANASTTQLTSTGASFLATTGGNVGVGTAAPLYKLDVTDTNKALTSNTFNAVIRTSDNQGVDVGGSLAFGGAVTNAGTTYGTFGAIAGRKETNGNGTVSGYLQFATTPAGGVPTEAMRITSAGNLGIGTNGAADARLTVGTNSTVNATSTDQIFLRSQANTNLSAGAEIGGISFQAYDDNAAGDGVISARIGAFSEAGQSQANAPTYLSFFTNTGDARVTGNLAERLRITAAGLVGIGTTTPTTALGVQGDELLSGNLSLANLTATGTASVLGTATLGNVIDSGLTANTLVYANTSKQLASVATSTVTLGTGFGYSGTLGSLVGGTSGTLTIATTSLGLATSFYQQNGNAFGTTANLGTTDSNALAFITAGTEDARFDAAGNFMVGATATTTTGIGQRQFVFSASEAGNATGVGAELLIQNPHQITGGRVALTFGGRAGGTLGYTAKIGPHDATGDLDFGTQSAANSYIEPTTSLRLKTTGDLQLLTGVLTVSGTATSTLAGGLAVSAPVSATNVIDSALTANALIFANANKGLASVTTGTAGNVLALLNGIPTWTATTTAGTGLTYSAGAFNVNTTQNISTLSNLATAGFVKTSATGVLSVDTNTYLTSSTGVTSVSNVDGSLTVSPTTGAVIASLNLAHANTFTALQQFNANASTTQFTSTGSTYLATAGGNVGVGTTSPLNILDVEAATASNEQVARFSAVDAASSDYFLIANRTNNAGQFGTNLIGQQASSNGKSLTITGSTLTTQDSGTGPLVAFNAQLTTGNPVNGTLSAVATRPLFDFENNTASVATILANGNFGIGSTSPSQVLSVAGNGYFTGNINVGTSGNISSGIGLNVLGSNSGQNVGGNFENTHAAGYSGFNFYDSTGTLAGTVQYANSSAATLPNTFIIGSRNGTAPIDFVTSAGLTPQATILANGNVGIGSSTPLFKLSVEGTSSLGNQATAGFFTGTTTATSTLAGPLSTLNLAITSIASGKLLKTGTGGYVVAATGNTDYQTPITLTTTGSSGAATFNGTTLNVPQYAGASYTGTYPIQVSGSAISLAFGTTTSNTWAGTQTFTNSPVFSTLGAGTVNVTAAGTIYNTATSTLTLGGEFVNTGGTFGAEIGGTSGTLSLQTNGTALTKLSQIAANTILGNATGATGNVTAFATSTLGIALSDTTGTLAVNRGGTGTPTPPTYGQLLVGNASGGYTLTATSSLGIVSGVTSIDASGGSTGLTFTGGPITTSGTLTLGGLLGLGSGGTGTTTFYNGGVLFSNGSLLTQSAAAANFFWDETNKRLGLGTTTPKGPLAIQTATNAANAFTITNSTGTTTFEADTLDTAANIFSVATTTGTDYFDVTAGGTINFNNTVYASCAGLTTNSAGTIQCSVSDQRLKQNVTTLGSATGLDAINALNPVSFNYIDPNRPQGLQYGLIAQQVQQVLPNLVATSSPTIYTPGGTLTVNYDGLFAPLIKSVQQLDARTHSFMSATTTATSTVLTVDATGKVGIGTATPTHTLEVAGDIGAISFVNTSTQAAKTNITYLDATSTDNILDQIRTIQIAQYRYKIEPSSNPLRLGLIAEQSPSIVLSPDGKGVDIYKLTTFTLAGVQALTSNVDALSIKVDSLASRIEKLENNSIGMATSSPFSTSTLATAFNSMGAYIENGIAQFDTLVARRFVAAKDSKGDSSAGSGVITEGQTYTDIDNPYVSATSKIFITMTSSVDGSWYLSDKQDGVFRVMLSKEQDADVTFDYFIVETEGQLATPSAATSTPTHLPPPSGTGHIDVPPPSGGNDGVGTGTSTPPSDATSTPSGGDTTPPPADAGNPPADSGSSDSSDTGADSSSGDTGGETASSHGSGDSGPSADAGGSSTGGDASSGSGDSGATGG